MSIGSNYEQQLVTKLLLQVSARELRIIMVIPPEECGLMESRDAENHIIISDSMLRKILPSQLKNMSEQFKVMWGCEYCISDKIMHLLILS